MGSPWTEVWDEFAVRSPSESSRRLQDAQTLLAPALTAPLPADPVLRAQVERARAILEALPPPLSDERGATLPRWYRGGFHINLPDVPDGYAVLTATAGGLKLETVSHGLRLGL